MRVEPTAGDEPIGAGQLFREYSPFVASFLARLGVAPAELDDMVQEVFVVVHRKGGYVSGPAKPRSWLAAIALNIAQAGRRLRATRNAREAPSGDELDEVASIASDPAQRFEAQRSVERVQRALDRLPVEYRVTFMLYEFEGESCESIAAVWNVPIGTVYSRLHNARRRFLKAYEALVAAPNAPAKRVAGAR